MRIKGGFMEKIQEFLSKRPYVNCAFGYGSGVFKQVGYDKLSKPQIDLILGVPNLREWHLQNMEMNPSDYSYVGKCFYKKSSIDSIKGMTGMTYQSNIEENGSIFKYGIIENETLKHNLITWESFYVAGRFQKPVLEIKSNSYINNAININREQALIVALLTMDIPDPTLMDLYANICGLSYMGDTRMKLAENPRKVLNIVEGSFDKFKDMYGTEHRYFKTENGKIIINYNLLNQDKIYLPGYMAFSMKDIDQTDKELLKQKIIEYLTKLNKEESLTQTIKGIYTNGPVKSISYAKAKVMKKITSTKK